MPDLVVPAAELNYESLPSGLAALEKPIGVMLPDVRFPDGALLGLDKLAIGGFLAFRRTASATEPEVWIETAKEWKPESSVLLEDLEVTPMMYKEGDPHPWQGILIGIGQTDKNGIPKLHSAIGSYPAYFVRASFKGESQGQTFSGIGPPSRAVRLIGLQDAMLAGLGLGPNEQPTTASLIRLYLRGDSLQVIGMVEIRKSGGGAEIEVTNGAASIRLQPDGRIEITPSNQGVAINGDVEVERIYYQPYGGGGKRWINV